MTYFEWEKFCEGTFFVSKNFCNVGPNSHSLSRDNCGSSCKSNFVDLFSIQFQFKNVLFRLFLSHETFIMN